MNLNHNTSKNNGDQLTATEWNNLAADVNELGAGGVGGGSVEGISISDKGNTEITSTKHVNIEPVYDETGAEEGTYGDIQLKPGDDITLESSHRAASKKDEITVKTTNGAKPKGPVKLQIIADGLTLSTKGSLSNTPNVMNVNVTDGTTKGYLKVRAQAIDLRSETHGGIALQPKGTDGQGNMNKIKFEHGGGDGLEFGTFNTEHTSLFTGDYRFNKNGVIRLATRTTVASDKADANDATTAYKYVKQNDDFYDVIAAGDPTCTWEDIVTYIAWAKANNQGPWAAA